jgi:hypothetical protein
MEDAALGVNSCLGFLMYFCGTTRKRNAEVACWHNSKFFAFLKKTLCHRLYTGNGRLLRPILRP